MSPIIDIQRRLAETGRIRIGQQVASTNGKRPSKLEMFRLTSGSEKSLRSIAAKYGGKVQKWEEAPVAGQWELFTESSTLDVLIPPEAMSFSQFYELWSGGGCQRRCDGDRLVPSEDPCVCDPENRECKPHTRLSVMLADLPGAGLWRLDTQGWNAATELGGAFELALLISQATGRSIVPGVLRLDQREVKRPNPRDMTKTLTRKFAVPVLDFDVNMTAIARGTTAALSSGVTPVPELEETRSFGDELQAINDPPEKKKRSNSAEPVRPTGIRPHARGISADDDERDFHDRDETTEETHHTDGEASKADPTLFEELKTAWEMLNDDERQRSVQGFVDLKMPTRMSEWNNSQVSKGLTVIRGAQGFPMEAGEPTDPVKPPVVTEGAIKPDDIKAPRAQRNKITQLNIRFDEAGFGDREIIHAYATRVIKREILSLNDLTTAEANLILDQLAADAEQ